MDKRGMKDMLAINCTINKVINKPAEKISVSEAKLILKKCGVMTKSEKIKREYKKILVTSEETSNGEK